MMTIVGETLYSLISGMVSQEEYEYSAFKCAFCNAYNPSKKLRPTAPKLPLPSHLAGDQSFGSRSVTLGQEATSSTSASEKDSSKAFYYNSLCLFTILFYSTILL